MPTNRRDLFKAALGLAALPQLARASAPPSASDWPSIRQQFRFAKQAPLNAANLCPAYTRVLEDQGQFAQSLSADVSFLHRRDNAKNHIEAARKACARMLGLRRSEDLALVRNTSEANAIIVNGFPLGAKDEVLLWDENHATNYRSWHYRHLRDGFTVRSFSLPANPAKDQDLIQPILDALTPQTRVLSFSHLSNISGLRLPAAAICAAVKRQRPDLFIHIDGAQSWGSMAVDLDEIGCDSYSSSAHKWLCGPRGVGVLMIRENWARRIQPLILGYDLNFDYPEEQLQTNAQRFENLGQRDTAALAALRSAIEAHTGIGIERIEQRIQELTQYALNRFAAVGIETTTPKQSGFGHGVVIARLSSDMKAYGAFLALHNAGYAAAFVHGNRVHCTPTGEQPADGPVALRICPHIYNSEDDIDAAVAIASRIENSTFEILKEAIRFL